MGYNNDEKDIVMGVYLWKAALFQSEVSKNGLFFMTCIYNSI